MIRSAQTDDFDAILAMSRRFWALLDYPEEFIAEDVMKAIAETHRQGLLVVLEVAGAVVGFAAAIKSPLLANHATTIATELAYWVEPQHRGLGEGLLTALEMSARLEGCKYLNMVALMVSHPDVAEKIYRKHGYDEVERTYRKPMEKSWQ